MSLRAPAVAGLVLGGAAAVAAGGVAWSQVSVAEPGLPAVAVTLSGRALVPALSAGGLAALATGVAVLVTRGWWRRLVGAVGVVVGGLVVLGVVRYRADPQAALAAAAATADLPGAVTATTTAPWWVLGLAAGLVIAGAGLLVVVSGAAWGGMSVRYERPGQLAHRPRGPARSPSGTPWTAGRTRPAEAGVAFGRSAHRCDNRRGPQPGPGR